MNSFNRFQARFGNDSRFARVLHGSLCSVASRGIKLLINVLTLPLTLHDLGAFAVLMGLPGQWVYHLWLIGVVVPSHGLLWLMAFFAFLISATTNPALLLAATGRLHLEATLAVLTTVSGLSIWLVQAYEVKRALRGHKLEPQSQSQANPHPLLEPQMP